MSENDKDWEKMAAESETLVSISEGGTVAKAKKKKHDIYRKLFGLPSSAWKDYITDHLRKAGLKGRSFEDAQKAMIKGAHRWRMARAYDSPIYPMEYKPKARAVALLSDFEIMKYAGSDTHDYFPHRANLRSGARVIVPDIDLLRGKGVPVITRGKGYLFEVNPSELMFVVPQLSKRQMEEAKREFVAFMDSPEAKAIEKKYGLDKPYSEQPKITVTKATTPVSLGKRTRRLGSTRPRQSKKLKQRQPMRPALMLPSGKLVRQKRGSVLR